MKLLKELKEWRRSTERLKKNDTAPIEALRLDLRRREYIKLRLEEMLKDREGDPFLLLSISYSSLPRNTRTRVVALNKVSREAIMILVKNTHPKINGHYFMKEYDQNLTHNERVLLIEVAKDVMENNMEIPSEHKKTIGLDPSRVRMAYFWKFDENYTILDDKDSMTEAYFTEVSVLDVRDGSISIITNPENIEKLLDMKEWFVFGKRKKCRKKT